MKIHCRLIVLGSALLLGGCAWNPAAPRPEAAAANACPKRATYEVTWDGGCGDRCGAYPVSHRSPAAGCDETRVAYRGTPTGDCRTR